MKDILLFYPYLLPPRLCPLSAPVGVSVVLHGGGEVEADGPVQIWLPEEVGSPGGMTSWKAVQ